MWKQQHCQQRLCHALVSASRRRLVQEGRNLPNIPFAGLSKRQFVAGAATSSSSSSSSSSSPRPHVAFDPTVVAAALSVVGVAATTLFSTEKVACEASATTKQIDDTDNPLWPSGVDDRDVEAFVDSVLKDKTMNDPAIPDVLEKRIYKTTVKLVLNLLYKVVSKLDGVPLFAHRLDLQKERKQSTGKNGRFPQKTANDIDETVLEEVADRLLANPAINQAYLPDIVERRLYINCLKLVFRLLDTIVDTFQVTICGHDLKLHLEPSKQTAALKSSLTSIDLHKLQERYASNTDGTVMGDFSAKLHASLYALILGLVDDLLANSEIQLLSDVISIDVVDEHHKYGDVPKDARQTSTRRASKPKQGAGGAVTFLTGMGAGAALTAFLLLAAPRK